MGKKLWFHLQERRKNNKGASLVMVIIIMGLVMILVATVMSMTLMNFRMKYTNLQSQKTFYTAESALTEIRAGLAWDVSTAAALAYTDTMEHFAAEDEEGRKKRFCDHFKKSLLEELGCDTYTSTYSLDYLDGLLKETAYSEAALIGAKVTAPAHNNIYNEKQDAIILKNVTVTYQDAKDYMTQIKTDIVLGVPDIEFGEDPGTPVLPAFALVAGKRLEVTGNVRCRILGNAYIGDEINRMGEGAELTVERNPSSSGRELLIAGSTLKGENNGSIRISNMEIWAENFVVDSSRAKVSDSAVYLKNDLVLGRSWVTPARAELSGEFFGYGNLDTAAAWAADKEDTEGLRDIQENPADYSSSIIVNGTGISETEKTVLDLSGLSSIKIAGNSYVNGRKYKNKTSSTADLYTDINAEDVRMGESVSTRTSQLAYLVPADCIAPDMVNGGTNPMPVDQYSALLDELEAEYGSKEAAGKLVDFDAVSEKLQGNLRSYGVLDYQIEAHQLVNVGSMIYIFVKFDTEEAANRYFDQYYRSVGSAKLGGLLDQTYVSIQMPDDTSDSRFYFNGNILAGAGTGVFIPAKLETASEEEKKVQKAEEKQYQSSYEALTHKLVKFYDELSEEEKEKNPYKNLVKSMISAEWADYSIPAEGHKSFVKSTGEAAVIVNGSYEISAEQDQEFLHVKDALGNEHPNAELHVVIASGDVTVTRDFKGMILAGGTVKVTKNAAVTSDYQAAGLALMAGNGEGLHAYDYLVNGNSYIIAGSEDEEGDRAGDPAGGKDMISYVTYENWTKQ